MLHKQHTRQEEAHYGNKRNTFKHVHRYPAIKHAFAIKRLANERKNRILKKDNKNLRNFTVFSHEITKPRWQLPTADNHALHQQLRDAIISGCLMQSRAAVWLALPVATYHSPFDRWLRGRGTTPVALDIRGEFGVPDREDVSRRGMSRSGSGGTVAVCRGVPNTAEQHVGPLSDPINTHNPRDIATNLRIRLYSSHKILYMHKKGTQNKLPTAHNRHSSVTASGRQLSLCAHAQTLLSLLLTAADCTTHAENISSCWLAEQEGAARIFPSQRHRLMNRVTSANSSPTPQFHHCPCNSKLHCLLSLKHVVLPPVCRPSKREHRPVPFVIITTKY